MLTFKQHASGFIFVKTSARGRYRLARKSEVVNWFPLIFETVKNLDVHKLRRIYTLDIDPVMEGVYDGRFGYEITDS